MKILKNFLAGLAMAIHKVDGKTIQNRQDTVDDVTKPQMMNQSEMLNAMLRGVVTEEVDELRWRNFLTILKEEENRVEKDKVRLDIINDKNPDKPKLVYYCDDITTKRGVFDFGDDITSETVFTDIDCKTKTLLNISRGFTPKFYFEDYSEALYVRDMGDNYYDVSLKLELSNQESVEGRLKKTMFSFIERNKGDMVKLSKVFEFDTMSFVSSNFIGLPNGMSVTMKYISLNGIERIYTIDEEGTEVLHSVVLGFRVFETDRTNTFLKYRNEKVDEAYAKKEERKRKNQHA